MSCSKEEIERKRLAAIQKRQTKLSSPNSPLGNISISNTTQGSPSFTAQNINGRKLYHPYKKPEINESENIPVTKVVSGTIYLISESRFEVNPSEFCVPLINIFKSISSKCYDANTKLWNFSIEDYEQLMSKVAPLAPHVVLGALPAYVLKVVRENITDPNNIDLTPVEATLRNKLMPFQEDGVRFGIAHRGRCMIADDMGLGKTFQALAIASYYKHNWPLLIVTTSSMRDTWQNKVYELLPSVPLMNIVTLSSGKDTQLVADKQTEVVIVSYKITSMHTDLLKSKNFGVVILDESHHLKSNKSQCTTALVRVCRGAARVLLLSGTPALSRPVELYTQLLLIDNKFFGSYTEYGKRYCAGRQTNFGWDMSGQSNLAELQILLQKKFLIRRTKEQVLTTLESKTRETVLLDESLLQFSKEDQKELSEMADTWRASRPSDKHSALISYFTESARVKTPAICKYIKQVIKEEGVGKFLVFAHHRSVVQAVCAALDQLNTRYICIDGHTPSTSRAELVERFQHVAACRCAVLSLTAAGAGITLTAANLVLFAELHWNPGMLMQAESRAHRIGCCGEVRVRYLLANNTADDFIWPMLQNKLDVLNNVGLSGDTFKDTTITHQNKNDFIPGTNIRKNSIQQCDMPQNGKSATECTKNEESFLEHDQDDDLLANLEL
ncbi:SWI/SNF-related matrix-associated actin-dependent regulator of chromatin subfamily A-like protein 1 isoform X2 [Papilio machaon]|uniref:SWI/SNF-related matrix-associated actin-dependent regulator of chromatin subfamily A-like protein 1 isoform X2 n=1 Tax=Papilio machaon TaxID=76193 RepID=UPI001E6656D4|nr:SWI/SNF-related matrix-associated actin-dependent regulator of chromatin subfamily A-like protein 1 isoform X2 [Papilio machaon]